jgi:ABC-type phosphonate transport system ATPase subunit
MERKKIYTLEELRAAAREQNLRVEEKDGKYQVVRTVSERLGLVVVKAGDGYSLNHDGLREFLVSNGLDIGERITDWSTRHEPKLHQ